VIEQINQESTLSAISCKTRWFNR